MKKIILLVVALCVCLPTFAKDQKHKLEIAYEGSDYGYREPHMDYPIHITAKKQGGSIVYTRQSVLSSDLTDDDPSFASIEFRYMDGKADYDGYLMDGTPFKSYDEKDYYMEAALKFGRKYHLANPLQLRPYIGIGWRSLRNGEDGIQDYGGVLGETYQRTSTYIYMPIGAHFMLDVGDHMTLSLTGEFDWLIHGRQSSHTNDFENTNTISNSQDHGYGVRASGKLEIDMGPFGVFVEPFWRYWKIQNSSKFWYDLVTPGGTIPNAGYYLEPFNITREYGVRTGITF